MRALGISVISLALTAGVISNAYYQKKQFYPSVVYITKSNPSMAVIYIQAFILVLLVGKLMRKIFFGQLRAAEFEHLIERSWYAVTETCLAFTVFRDDFNPKFVALFTVLLFLKSFHWLAEDRVDYMERSPVISWIFHVRVLGLLALLGALDIHFLSLAYNSTVTKGASVQLVFGFEYAILLTMVANTAIKYCLHSADLRSESPWDGKAVLLLYSELAVGCLRVLFYIAFVAIMVRIYTLPLFAFRPMYYTMRNFKKAFNDVILSRRAIRNMNTLYADATPQELAEVDNVCIICRDIMTTNAKKLPCNHIFHTSCLRSWFQRQQTCPTCRLDILRPVAQNVNPQAQAGAAPAAQPGAVPMRPPQQAAGQADAAANTGHGNVLGQDPTANIGAGAPFPQFIPPVGFPPFPFPMQGLGMVAPPPIPPENLATLTDEELQALEGTERKHVEARIKYLRNIQLLLDASMTLMQQYQLISARLPTVVPTTIPTNVSSTSPSASTSTAATTVTASSSNVTPTVSNENSQKNNTASAMEQGAPEPVEVASSGSKGKSNILDLNQPSTSRTVFDSELKETDDSKLTPEEKFLSEMISSETDELRRRRLKRFEATNMTE